MSGADFALWVYLSRTPLLWLSLTVLVYVLVDARHGLKPPDEEVFKLLDESAMSYQVVLTKADQVKPPALEMRMAETAAALRQHPAAYPGVIITSAHAGSGLGDLRAAIARLLAEKS